MPTPTPASPLRALRLAPGARLAAAVAVCLVSAVLCVWLAASPPWLGITFDAGPGGAVPRVAAVAGPAAQAGVRRGETLVALQTAAARTPLDSLDLLEEPDFLDTWPAMDAFFARQTRLTAQLGAPAVGLALRDAGGAERVVTVAPGRRPVSTLPLVFWAQLVFGATGCVIGVWVWTLRPADPGARVYAVTGACFLVFAHAASIYSARELALPGGLFRALSGVNHLGADLFGAALCALFLSFPRPAVGARGRALVFAAAFLWWLLDVTRVAPDQNWASRYLVMTEMLAALALALWQSWRARRAGDPAARAMLRWSGWSVALGCGAFIGLTQAVSAAGRIPPLPQGYAFGFFVLMYAGLALAVARTRVFDLDLWALRLLGWGLGIATFTALALYLVGAGQAPALQVIGLALLVALAWAPMRRLVWSRLTRRGTLPPEELVERVLPVAFAASDAERGARWQALLGALFDPLHVAALPDGAAPTEAALADDGLALVVPAVASSPALRLGHPWGGRRLFAGRHLALVRTLVRLLHAADERRRAYEVAFERGLQQGVQRGTLGERTRIARDLHDAVSSPLLAGLAPPAAAPATPAGAAGPGPDEIRRAVQQMRTIVSGTAADPAPLADAVADARYDAVRRLRAAGLVVEWPLADLGPAGETALGPEARQAFAAFCQEAVTNILRHAAARHVTCVVRTADDAFRVEIADDGVGFDPDATPAGQGLPNLHARAATLGGRVRIARGAGDRGTVVHLDVPLAAREAAA
mgnify:CR=1 FL=1